MDGEVTHLRQNSQIFSGSFAGELAVQLNDLKEQRDVVESVGTPRIVPTELNGSDSSTKLRLATTTSIV